jgi:hypothetical protein
MTPNIGSTDRTLRLLAGAALILLALFSGIAAFDGAVLKYGALIVGVVMIVTASMRICPLYTILGIRTCKV